MSDPDLILSILRELRGEIRALDTKFEAKFDETNRKLDNFAANVDARFDLVDQRLVILEMGVQHLSNDMYLVKSHLRQIVDTAITDLQRRLKKIPD